MKREIAPATMAIVVGVVVVVLLGAAYFWFTSNASGGAPIVPKPWAPPGMGGLKGAPSAGAGPAKR